MAKRLILTALALVLGVVSSRGGIAGTPLEPFRPSKQGSGSNGNGPRTPPRRQGGKETPRMSQKELEAERRKEADAIKKILKNWVPLEQSAAVETSYRNVESAVPTRFFNSPPSEAG